MNNVVAVTGGLGFIGSHVVDFLLDAGRYVYLVDAETYAANCALLDSERWQLALRAGTLKYVHADISSLAHLPDVDAVVNLAAETHVDNSIADSTAFVRSNFLGVQRLLELVRAKRAYEMPRFLQVSTDEVYGNWTAETPADESAPLRPSSPYAASKAAADLLCQAYAHTYGLTYNLVRPSNCYGLRQYPEKLIPKAIRYLHFGKPMPIHRAGTPRRMWLHVADCAHAILTVLDHGEPNAIYNVAGNCSATVEQVVNKVAEAMPDCAYHAELQFQRAGLDTNYWTSDAPLRALPWAPTGNLWADLPGLVEAERKTFRW